jgi:hypothetical protein
MSGGRSCYCPEKQKPVKDRAWRVLLRRGNRSAFNGYRWAPSDYSAVTCIDCRATWRTRASYVDFLSDWNQAEEENRKKNLL